MTWWTSPAGVTGDLHCTEIRVNNVDIRDSDYVAVFAEKHIDN